MAKIANIGLLTLLMIPMGIIASGSDMGPASHSGVHASTAPTTPVATTSSQIGNAGNATTTSTTAAWNNDIGTGNLSEQLAQEQALRHIQFLQTITPTLPASAHKVIGRMNANLIAPNSSIRKIMITGAKGTGRNSCAQAITLATNHRAGIIDLEKLHTYGFSLPSQASQLDAAIDEQSSNPLMIILLALDTLNSDDKEAVQLLEHIISKAEYFGHVSIMATICDEKKLLPIFRSKFNPTHKINTSLPCAESRKAAIEHQLSIIGCEPALIDSLVKDTEGLSCSDIELICNEVIGNASVNNPVHITAHNIKDALDFHRENNPEFNSTHALKPLNPAKRDQYLSHTHSDIRHVIQKLSLNRQNTPGSNRYIVILIGPAGSGKTTLAQAVGEAAGKTCFTITPQDVLTKYQNCLEENLASIILPIAESQIPAAIIIDEFKHLISTENGKKASAEYRSRGVWSVLDKSRTINPNLVIIGTTNDLDETPKPLQDRMSERIQIDQPNTQARRDLIMTAIAGKIDEQECPQSYLDWLINRKTKGRSYREINELLFDASCQAEIGKRRIHATDFNFAMRNWTEWYHLRSLWTTCQPHILPTLEKLTPLALQLAGLYFNQQGIMLQRASHDLQTESHDLQSQSYALSLIQAAHTIAAHKQSVDLQKELHDQSLFNQTLSHRESIELQKTHQAANQQNHDKSYAISLDQAAINWAPFAYKHRLGKGYYLSLIHI